MAEALFRNVPAATRERMMAADPKRGAALMAEGGDRQAGFDRLREAVLAGRFPPIPFVQIGATGHPGPDSLLPVSREEIREKVRAKHARTAGAYALGEFIEADTGHYVQFDDPDLVCEVIGRFLA